MEKTISRNRIKSIMYDMYTINVEELDLSSFDDKQYIQYQIHLREDITVS